MPSYYSLGFETREQNLTRNFNETYSKLYVFKITDKAETDKVTNAPFIWGNNEEQFREILKLRKRGESILSEIHELNSYVLKYPSERNGVFIWSQYPDSQYIFVANISNDKEIEEEVVIQHISKYKTELIYQELQYGKHECRIYKTLK